MNRVKAIGRIAGSLATVGAITVLYTQWLHANPTTAALTYVVVVLVIATAWDIVEATLASLAAVLCLNFFFLPPVGTFTITDPQNWVALIGFLMTAIIASQLSSRARRRHLDATTRQRDLERLYALSRGLLLLEGGASFPAAVVRHIADAFELSSAALYDHHTDTVSWAGPTEIPGIDRALRDVARQGLSIRDRSGMVTIAIRLGGSPIGSLALMDDGLDDTVLQSVANLAAIGLERARGQEAAARAEAARQSGELRATVLDALAHEFKTPLTSMKAAAGALLAWALPETPQHELAMIVDEDLGRLQALVTDAVHMLRIDAGDFLVHADRYSLGDIVSAVVRPFEARLDGRVIVERVPPALVVDADRELLSLALRQLLDNAVKYSPASSQIEIDAAGNGSVEITVRNRGPVIPAREQERIFERFYRGSGGRHTPGTGIGLSIVKQIALAHSGTLTVSSTAETGTAFTLSLPRGAAPV